MAVFVRASRRAKSYIRNAGTLGSMLTRTGKRETLRRGMIHTGRPKGTKAGREHQIMTAYRSTVSKLNVKKALGREIFKRAKSVDAFDTYTMRIGKFSANYRKGR